MLSQKINIIIRCILRFVTLFLAMRMWQIGNLKDFRKNFKLNFSFFWLICPLFLLIWYILKSPSLLLSFFVTFLNKLMFSKISTYSRISILHEILHLPYLSLFTRFVIKIRFVPTFLVLKCEKLENALYLHYNIFTKMVSRSRWLVMLHKLCQLLT